MPLVGVYGFGDVPITRENPGLKCNGMCGMNYLAGCVGLVPSAVDAVTMPGECLDCLAGIHNGRIGGN